jgi:predicted dehydrogenase
MKELLGEIGRPLYFSSTRIGLGLFQRDVDVSLDLGIHCLSILDYLYPELELVNKTIIKHTHVGEVPDQVLGDFVFNDGFTCHINCNWISPVKKRSIILTGEKGSIVYDDIAINKLQLYKANKEMSVDYNANSIGNVTMPAIDSTEALYKAKEHYIECLEKRCDPLTNIHNTTKIMQWILA